MCIGTGARTGRYAYAVGGGGGCEEAVGWCEGWREHAGSETTVEVGASERDTDMDTDMEAAYAYALSNAEGDVDQSEGGGRDLCSCESPGE